MLVFTSEHMPTCVILYHQIELLMLCCVSLHPLPLHFIPSHIVSVQDGGCLCRLRLCWDRVLDPAAKHVQLDKRVRGAQANIDLSHLLKPEPGGDEAASSSGSDQDSDHQVTLTQGFYNLH